MKSLLLVALAVAFVLPLHAEHGTALRIDFSNPGLSPSTWSLVLHPDGSAHFHSERGNAASGTPRTIEPATVDRDVRLDEQFASRVFDTVHRHDLLRDGRCESHLKVAFQGWKKLSYSGPDGSGSCEFNYSKDKEIQALGDALVSVASTIVEGARLELLLQHDPLGLDRELQYIHESAQDGRLQQICAIRGILMKLEEDPLVMERVRKYARTLLAETGK